MNSLDLTGRKSFCRLLNSEKRWTKYFTLLEENGYALRPRYNPDWVPECIADPTKDPLFCEDTLRNITMQCLDATRIRDGMPIMLKFSDSTLPESAIAMELYKKRDRRNHTIPVDGIILLPDDRTRHILVMERMRQADHPPFVTVGEVLEFLQQVFEGVEFMHRNNVAHCDIAMGNIVMDSFYMIPGGFHPVSTNTQDGVSKPITLLSRTEVAPVRYYFIDFGLSVFYTSFEERGLVQGVVGQHKNIPELSEDIPYDPFKLDIRQIGEMIKKEFLDKYWGLDCLIPLTKQLRRDDPDERPDAPEAFRAFSTLAATIDEQSARLKLIPRKGFQPVHWVHHAVIPRAKRFRQ